MAIVEGPMCSLSARKKFGDVFVNFVWKGLHILRMRVSPTQPRTPAVMNLRIKVKCMGKVSKFFSTTSTLMADIKLKTPARKPWNGWWVGVAIKQFQVDNAAYDVLQTELSAHAELPAINDRAIALGLIDETLTVKGKSADHPASYPKSTAFYSLMKACWYMEVLDENDVAYTDPADWDTAAVVAFYGRVID